MSSLLSKGLVRRAICAEYSTTCTMANSKYDYVRSYESDDRLLPNAWIVVRVDGKGFHK